MLNGAIDARSLYRLRVTDEADAPQTPKGDRETAVAQPDDGEEGKVCGADASASSSQTQKKRYAKRDCLSIYIYIYIYRERERERVLEKE